MIEGIGWNRPTENYEINIQTEPEKIIEFTRHNLIFNLTEFIHLVLLIAFIVYWCRRGWRESDPNYREDD